MSGFSHIDRVLLPRAAGDETQKFLRSVGRNGQEGLVLWVGHPEGSDFHVTQLLIPRQRAIRSVDGVCAIVDAHELHRINLQLFESGLRLIGQVHSHPTDAYHSPTDDENAIANTVGCLSLVIPNFAAGPFDLVTTAVYRLSQKGEWLELNYDAATSLIRLT